MCISNSGLGVNSNRFSFLLSILSTESIRKINPLLLITRDRCTTFAKKTEKGMKIKLNESENSIKIKDGLKNQYLILKILMILNIANAVIRIFGKQTTEYGFIEYFWIGLGIISLVVLFIFLFKMSTAENIHVEQISRLLEKTVFGKKRFVLKLKNNT